MCVYSVGKVDSVCGAGKLLYEVDTIRLEDLCVQGTTPLTMSHSNTPPVNRAPSMDFSFYDQPYIHDIIARQTAHQSLCGDFFNLSIVSSISAAF